MTKNVFVLGIDDFNLAQLKSIKNADQYNFHGLLTFDEVKGGGTYPFEQVLDSAREQLAGFPDRIDGVVGYWDFPVTSIVPILCREFGLPGPSVESVAKCEHKLWSRMEQRRAIPEFTPDFDAVDPFADDPLASIDLPYPFWLKPIKGTDSLLAFKIHNEHEFRRSIEKIRANIGHVAEPFNRLLEHVALPEDIASVDGSFCLAEQVMPGRQCTVSGYAHDHRVHVYGVVDSINYPGHSSFFRYEYPSRLPRRVKDRLIEASERIMAHIGYDQAAFNIEYFYDPKRDHIWLLEINPRISQSHGHLYEQVDGYPNHQVMVELAVGRAPDFPRRQGPYHCAAEFHLRRFEDSLVTRVPTQSEVKVIEQEMGGCIIDIKAHRCEWLSEMIEQDSYSFDIAHIFMGAHDQKELLEKYHRCVERLRFEFEQNS